MTNAQIVALIAVALIIVLYLYWNRPMSPIPTIAPVTPIASTEIPLVIAEEPTSVNEVTTVPAIPPEVTGSSPSAPGPGTYVSPSSGYITPWLEMVEDRRLTTGGDVPGFPPGIKLDTWQACRDVCEANLSCGGWTANHANLCWLKKPGVITPISSPGSRYQLKDIPGSKRQVSGDIVRLL